MQYFVRRGENTQGPITHQQLIDLVRARKIVATDLVSNGPHGPFKELKTVWENIKNFSEGPQQPANKTATQTPTVSPQTSPGPSVTVPSPQNIAAQSSSQNWVLIGGISGGALLVLATVLVIIVMNSGNEQDGKNDIASKDNPSNSAAKGEKSKSENKTNVKTYDGSTPNKFAAAVFDTLKNNDVASHMTLTTITSEDMKYFADEVIAKKPDAKEQLESEIKRAERDKQKQYDQNSKAFSGIRKKTAENGIDWDTAIFVSATFEEEPLRGIGSMDNIKKGTIYFTVSSGENSVQLYLDDCLCFKDQWRCGDGLRFKGVMNKEELTKKTKKSSPKKSVAKNKTEGKSKVAGDNSKWNNSYVVPKVIEKFPVNFAGHSPSQILKELKSLPFRKKDEFETKEEFAREMQAIWPTARLLGQPASNSYAFVKGITPPYDAEKKAFSFKCEPFIYFNDKNEKITLEYDALKTKRKAAGGAMIGGQWYSSAVEYYGMDKVTFDWPCEVELARKLKSNDLFRVAIVFKLGPRGMSGRDAGTPKDFVLAGQDYSPLEPRIHYSKILKKSLFRNRLWLLEDANIFVFRSDNGEILCSTKNKSSTSR